MVADTSWRGEPEAFPAHWLLPAVAVIAATVIVGVLRYPHLPAYLTLSDHRVATSPASAFAVVVRQLYATGLWTGLLVLVYRSRPDLDTADPAASLRSYRKALGAFGRAGLILLACVDASVLLFALQAQQLATAASLPPLGIVALMQFNVITPSLGLALGLAAALLVIDGLAWRVVATMFNRERLVTGGRS